MCSLQDHVEESDFSSECQEEVARDQVRSNQDYRCKLAATPDPHNTHTLMLALLPRMHAVPNSDEHAEGMDRFQGVHLLLTG